MSQLSGLISCPELQEQLNTYFTSCDPTKLRETCILQNFLYSDANNVGGRQNKINSLTSPGQGKSRRVELVYSPRILESQIGSDGRDDCTSSTQIGETSTTYDVGNSYVQGDFYIDPMELRYKCQANELYFAEKLQQLIDAVIRARETALYNSIVLQYGSYASDEPGVTNKIKTTSTADSNGRFLPTAFEDIGTTAEYTGYCGRPIVLGGRTMQKYMKSVAAGCCSLEGVDYGELAAQYGMFFLGSYRADRAFGSNYFFTVAPGALQLIEWLEYEGPNGVNYMETEIYKQMVITDPATGARLDLKINLNCDGKWHVFVRSYFKLVTLPQDMFYAGDRLNGVNFVNRWLISN